MTMTIVSNDPEMTWTPGEIGGPVTVTLAKPQEKHVEIRLSRPDAPLRVMGPGLPPEGVEVPQGAEVIFDAIERLSPVAVSFLRSAAELARERRGRFFDRPDELLRVSLRDARAEGADPDGRFWLNKAEAAAVSERANAFFKDRCVSVDDVVTGLHAIAQEADLVWRRREPGEG